MEIYGNYHSSLKQSQCLLHFFKQISADGSSICRYGTKTLTLGMFWIWVILTGHVWLWLQQSLWRAKDRLAIIIRWKFSFSFVFFSLNRTYWTFFFQYLKVFFKTKCQIFDGSRLSNVRISCFFEAHIIVYLIFCWLITVWSRKSWWTFSQFSLFSKID